MSEHTQDRARDVVRRMRRITLMATAIGFGLYALILSPIYLRFSSDITFQNAWWVQILYYLTAENVCDLVVFAVCYPASLYAVWMVGIKRAMSIPVCYSLMTVLKFVLNCVVSYITDSALPQLSDFFYHDFLPIILPMVLLELLQYIIMLVIIGVWRHRYENRLLLSEAAAELGRDIPPPKPAFPFVRLVNVKNPVQGTAFLSALVLLIGRVAMHQIYQYALYITSGYTDGLVVMLIDLISDIFIAVLFYFAFLLLLPRFHEKTPQVA